MQDKYYWLHTLSNSTNDFFVRLKKFTNRYIKIFDTTCKWKVNCTVINFECLDFPLLGLFFLLYLFFLMSMSHFVSWFPFENTEPVWLWCIVKLTLVIIVFSEVNLCTGLLLLSQYPNQKMYSMTFIIECFFYNQLGNVTTFFIQIVILASFFQ